MVKIAPSILSADFGNLLSEIEKVEQGGADLLHIDIMDGSFVPNITMGPPILSCLKGRTKLPFDVHLMIQNPDKHVDAFIEAGADILTIHVESTVHLNRILRYIKSMGVKPAVALNPSTSLSCLDYVLDDVEMVLLMTVNPGFGGQSFIPSMLDKIRALKKLIKERNLDVDIEIDGGVSVGNAREIVNAGADILVAGSAVYKSPNPMEAIKNLKA